MYLSPQYNMGLTRQNSDLTGSPERAKRTLAWHELGARKALAQSAPLRSLLFLFWLRQSVLTLSQLYQPIVTTGRHPGYMNENCL